MQALHDHLAPGVPDYLVPIYRDHSWLDLSPKYIPFCYRKTGEELNTSC